MAVRRSRSGGSIVSVQVTGVSGVVRALGEVALRVEDQKEAFTEIARQGAVLGARYAPKLSGRLAGDVRGNRAKSKAVITAGRLSVPYAGPINYGWARRGIQGAFFLQRADQELQPYALRRLERDLNDMIRNQGLR